MPAPISGDPLGPGRDAAAVPGRALAKAGFGLALLPESSVDEELRTGTLRALRIRAMRVTIAVVLIHRRRAYQSGAAQALRAMLAAWPKAG